MVCLGILWNSMQEYLENVVEDVEEYGKVLDIFSLNLGDEYEKFVRDIYSQDEIAAWKVDKKIETMFQCSEGRKVTILLIDMETSKMEYHPLKKRYVFVNLESMKTDIRKKYSKLVAYYFFDNIFHVSDDEKEYKADLGVINTCIERGISKEDVNLSGKKIKILKKDNKNNGIKG